MTYLNILVEGPTEEQFANRVIKPYLEIFNIYIYKTINLNGSTKYSQIKRDINNLLKDPNRHVTTLFDYYGLKKFSKDFPGIEIKDDEKKDITDKINHIQKKFSELGITRIMEACPRFHNWIATLKKLENAK